MAESSSDAELLHRFATAADRDALDELVRRHIDFVYASARRQVRGRSDLADDVTQAVFLILAKKAKSVPAARLGGWLFRTTRYAAANARRSEARRAKYERNARAPEAAMPTESADTPHVLSGLDHALASLSDADRDVLILRYLQGHDIATVGERLGTSAGTAQRRVSRAVERLRRVFARRGFESTDTAAVVAAITLAAATTAPAATVASVTAAAMGGTAATASAAAISKGTLHAIWTAKLKAVATVAVSAGLVTGVGVGAVKHFSAPASTPATAADAYDGVWVVGRCETQDAGGLRLPPSATVRLSSHDRALTLSSLDANDRRHLAFASAGPPQQVDERDDANPALVRRGLIEWRGDELWLAFGPPGGDRPTRIGRGEASASAPLVLMLRRAMTGGKS